MESKMKPGVVHALSMATCIFGMPQEQDRQRYVFALGWAAGLSRCIRSAPASKPSAKCTPVLNMAAMTGEFRS